MPMNAVQELNGEWCDWHTVSEQADWLSVLSGHIRIDNLRKHTNNDVLHPTQ